MSVSHIVRVAQILRDVFHLKALKVTPYEVDNILDDPSFESGRLTDWRIDVGTADIDWSVYHIHGKSVKATGVAGKPSFFGWTHFMKGKGMMIVVLAGWYKADANVALFKPKIDVFDEKGGWLKSLYGDDLIALYTAPFDWKFYRICRVLPKETGLIQIGYYFTSGASAGNIWLDDLYLAIVPLTKDNILKFGTHFEKYKYVTATVDTFYAVSEDICSFLTSAQLMILHYGAGAHSGTLMTHRDTTYNPILKLEHSDAIDFSVVSQQFDPPLKLIDPFIGTWGTYGIRVEAGAYTTAHTCIQGYEIR